MTTIETVMMIPLYVFAFLGMFATFELYRTFATQQKIAYTIGDIISRETVPLDNSYMNGMRNLFKYLSNESSNSNVSLRVTVLYWDDDDNRHQRDWSQERGYRSSLSSNEVRDLYEVLPVMVDNERLILVETGFKYTTPFNTGLGDFEMKNRVFTRPRYAPQLLYDN